MNSSLEKEYQESETFLNVLQPLSYEYGVLQTPKGDSTRYGFVDFPVDYEPRLWY